MKNIFDKVYSSPNDWIKNESVQYKKEIYNQIKVNLYKSSSKLEGVYYLRDEPEKQFNELYLTYYRSEKLDEFSNDNDRYCYPDSNVLINKLNVTDSNELKQAERDFTLHAIGNIEYRDPPYDLEYLKSIHKQLFSFVYIWAGEVRKINLSKGNTLFCNVNRLEPESIKIFNDLYFNKYFIGLSKNKFVKSIVQLYADLNMIHPFREGNGRSQRIFFDHLAIYNDYIIDWNVVTKDAWLKANIDSVVCNYLPMEKIFFQAIKKI